MKLKILLPNQVFLALTNINSVVVETPEGSFGILPHRLDCASPLVPGILSYKDAEQRSYYIAIDQGIMVKTGDQVVISVRRAIAGNSLDVLQQAVKQEFLQLDQEQQELQNVLAKLESGFVKQFSSLAKD